MISSIAAGAYALNTERKTGTKFWRRERSLSPGRQDCLPLTTRRMMTPPPNFNRSRPPTRQQMYQMSAIPRRQDYVATHHEYPLPVQRPELKRNTFENMPTPGRSTYYQISEPKNKSPGAIKKATLPGLKKSLIPLRRNETLRQAQPLPKENPQKEAKEKPQKEAKEKPQKEAKEKPQKEANEKPQKGAKEKPQKEIKEKKSKEKVKKQTTSCFSLSKPKTLPPERGG